MISKIGHKFIACNRWIGWAHSFTKTWHIFEDWIYQKAEQFSKNTQLLIIIRSKFDVQIGKKKK